MPHAGAPAPASIHRHPREVRLGKLTVLLITAFVDMVGVLMVIPLLPFYAKDMGGGGLWVGVLVSAFSLAQLLSAPLWGRVSDRHGRRPALLIGLGAAAISYVVFAFAHSLWVLLLSRLVQGAGGGTVGVLQAYIADATEPKDRAKSLGWLSAATNAGVAIGPVLGSTSMQWGRAAPGLLAAGLCAVNMLFAWSFLAETNKPAERGPSHTPSRRGREVINEVVGHPGAPAPRLIWIYAIAMGAFAGFTATLALFLSARFGVTAATIGYVFMWTGMISVIVRALVLGKMVDWLGEAKLARLGQTLLGVGLMLMPFTWRVPGGVTVNLPGGAWSTRVDARIVAAAVALLMLALLARVTRAMERSERVRLLAITGGLAATAVVAVVWRGPPPLRLGMADAFPLGWRYVALALVITTVPLGTAFTFPCVTALLSHVIDPRERGVVMGVQQSFGGAARVLAPLWAGFTFDHWGTGYPFWTSAALVLGSLFLTFGIDPGAARGGTPAAATTPAVAPAAD
ncbi:MAG TPA: MFS transporter [Longimicrobium sp.]|nr:MFS transporter [Longimicrobium sp.]